MGEAKRKREQQGKLDKTLRYSHRVQKELRPLGAFLTLCDVFLAFGAVWHTEYDKIWLALCIIAYLITFLIYTCFPQYFLLCDSDVRARPRQSMISLYIPVICLFIAITTQDGIDYELNTRFFLLGSIVSSVLLVAFFVRTRFFHSPAFSKILVIVFIICSGFSLISGANYVLDHDPPTKTLSGTIQDKEKSSTRYNTSYDIYVTAQTEHFHFTVRREYYDQVMIGDKIAISMHSGGLGIPFVDIVKD